MVAAAEPVPVVAAAEPSPVVAAAEPSPVVAAAERLPVRPDFSARSKTTANCAFTKPTTPTFAPTASRFDDTFELPPPRAASSSTSTSW